MVPRTSVTYQGEVLKLGPTEFKLLSHLMRHPERVHSRAQLLDKVWGDHVSMLKSAPLTCTSNACAKRWVRPALWWKPCVAQAIVCRPTLMDE